MSEPIVSELPGHGSRDAIAITGSLATLQRGQLLVNTSGTWSKYVGTGTALAVALDVDTWSARSWPFAAPTLAGGQVQVTVLSRTAEVAAAGLIGLDSPAVAALAALGLIVRN